MSYIKYPRTKNLPFSQSNSSDDVWWKDCSNFKGLEVVVTEKLDGECTSMYRDHIHARSLDSSHHPSRSWVKQLHSTIAHEIPEGYRVCGENLYAFHSILYVDLPTYFFVYGIYDDKNYCLPWDEVKDFCALLNLHTVPERYRGPWDENLIRDAWTARGAFETFGTKEERPIWPDDFFHTSAEGYVVRATKGFHYDEFARYCAKFVRKNHVQSPHNWLTKEVVPNLLKLPQQA